MSIIISSSYNLLFLKESNFVLYTFSITTPMNTTWQWFKWAGDCTVTNHKSNWFKLLTICGLSMIHYGPGQVRSKYHTYVKFLPSNMENYIYGTICMQSHSPMSWEWLVPKWHQNSWHQNFWKKLEGLKSCPKWSEVTYAEWLIGESGYTIWRGKYSQKFHHGKTMCLQLDQHDGWHGYW